MEEVEQQMEQLEAMIDEEDQISEEIGAITNKLQFNNLTQEANNQIAAITVAYNQLQDFVNNGYDYYKDDKTELTQYAKNVILPMNSMETAADAFYQSLVVHPPGSPNCALQQARDIALDELNGLSTTSDFSMQVEVTNGVNIVAERPMYFNYNGMLEDGSCQSGALEPMTEHYFAEGTVRPGFHSFICIQNPQTRDSDVKITYMKGDGSSAEQQMTVPARSRATVNVNTFFGELDGEAADFSAKVESVNGQAIVAERPMYFSYNGTWMGGHINLGSAVPLVKQYLAEGTTRPGFDSYLCIQNPGESQADISVTYMKGDGSNQQQLLQLAGKSRTTVKVNDVIGQDDSEASDFSAIIESTNGVSLVVERPMYFDYEGKWSGGSCQGAVPEPAPKLYFAEGTTRPGFDSYLCIQNPGDADTSALITYMKGDGSNQQQSVDIPARSRRTVMVNDVIGSNGTENCDFSASIESTDGAGIIAERSIYFNYMDKWNGGHVQSGVTSPSTKQYFAEGTRRPGFTTYLCIQNPEERDADVAITYMKGDGTSQVQKIAVPAKSRKTVNCSATATGTTLLSAYEDNMETLFKNSWLYQLMAAECVKFARDYDPVTYGTTEDYIQNYYNRYMKAETEMFLACTEQLVMSQVDVSNLTRSQTGVFNLPSDANAVLTRADELAQMALGEGVPVLNADGVVTDLNLGLNGRMIAGRDIVPAGTTTPPAVKARLHGTSNTPVSADTTELIPIPWLSQTHQLMYYDEWTGAAPYNTVSLDNTWSIVRYRFDNLPPGTYDILDGNNNTVSTGTVTASSGTNPDNPAETYSLTFGEFNTICNTRGGPQILFNASQWTAPTPTKSGALRESDSNHLQSLQDTSTGSLALWMYGTGGDHYTTYTYDQENRLERTITAGADMDIAVHYTFLPKLYLSDMNGNHYTDTHGFVSGYVTIKPASYQAKATYEFGVYDLSNSNAYQKFFSDDASASDETADYNTSDDFSYDSKTGQYTYHMVSGHQYKFVFKLSGHHYIDTHDNSNMGATLDQKLVLDGFRLLGF